MPATPAWPPESCTRLFVDQALHNGAEVALAGQAAHYLLNVMRIAEGDPVKLFDDRSGEYLAHVAMRGKRDLILAIDGQTRPREQVPDLWLCAAPVKKDRFRWIAEKATELGVRRLQPVRTERTNAPDPRPDKLRAQVIEAAEQCERTALPELGDPQSLDALLADWPGDRHLFFADERLHGASDGDFVATLSRCPGPAAILIGPEGGFTDAENSAIRACPMAQPVSLGPRILRADTAAIAAISLWMAMQGDWSTA